MAGEFIRNQSGKGDTVWIYGMNIVRMPVYFFDYMNDNGIWRKDSTGAIDFSRLDKLVDLYDRCYKAMRKVDTNHIVFMEDIWAWNLFPDPKSKGWSNVVYSLHFYKWTENSDYNAMKGFFDPKFADHRKWNAQYNVPQLAGEFTCFGKPQVWDYVMTQMVKEKWHWAVWSYQVTGIGTPGAGTPRVLSGSLNGTWVQVIKNNPNPLHS